MNVVILALLIVTITTIIFGIARWLVNRDNENYIPSATYNFPVGLCDNKSNYWAGNTALMGNMKSTPITESLDVEFDASSGNIIAYKYLKKRKKKDGFKSYHNNEIWKDNSIDADEIPTDDNTNGIYASKKPNASNLHSYKPEKRSTLVKLLLSGKVIEHEYGYRAEHADIVEILK